MKAKSSPRPGFRRRMVEKRRYRKLKMNGAARIAPYSNHLDDQRIEKREKNPKKKKTHGKNELNG